VGDLRRAARRSALAGGALATVVLAAGIALPAAGVLSARGPAPGREPPPAQSPAFRGGVDLVQMGVTVTDRAGRPATGLTPADFEIYEDGVRQAIRYFAAEGIGDGDPQPPLHLGVLLDVSGSMAEDVGFMRTASITLLRRLVEAVDFTLVEFDSEVRVTRFAPDDFPRLVARIRNQKVGGSTALYDAMGVYLDGADGQDGRTIMLVYTDGGDTRSALGLSELLDLLEASDVTVYVVSVLGRQPNSARHELRALLHRMAETTGGQAFFPQSTRDLDKVYDQVLAEIRSRYTLGYVSTNGRTDGAWRDVEVRVARREGGRGMRGLRVRTRRGYFAPLRGAEP
jgi:Ca-activated chloride channel family protein